MAVLVTDEKLLVLIFDTQFFFHNKTRDLSSGTSTATTALDGNFLRSLPFPFISPVPFFKVAPGPVNFPVPFGTSTTR